MEALYGDPVTGTLSWQRFHEGFSTLLSIGYLITLIGVLLRRSFEPDVSFATGPFWGSDVPTSDSAFLGLDWDPLCFETPQKPRLNFSASLNPTEAGGRKPKVR